MIIQNTICPQVKTVFNNGVCIGEIVERDNFFEACHVNGSRAVFSSFKAAKRLFEEVIKVSNKFNTDNQTTINF
jgi:hypothetical protein